MTHCGSCSRRFERQRQGVRHRQSLQASSVTPRLLAIDTTSEYGSLALAEGGRLVEEVALRSAEGFAHTLFGEIENLLRRHNLQFGDLDAFAAAAGPGAFTGVRVGLTAAKGLAEATAQKVVAVSNLQALAWLDE